MQFFEIAFLGGTAANGVRIQVPDAEMWKSANLELRPKRLSGPNTEPKNQKLLKFYRHYWKFYGNSFVNPKFAVRLLIQTFNLPISIRSCIHRFVRKPENSKFVFVKLKFVFHFLIPTFNLPSSIRSCISVGANTWNISEAVTELKQLKMLVLIRLQI